MDRLARVMCACVLALGCDGGGTPTSDGGGAVVDAGSEGGGPSRCDDPPEVEMALRVPQTADLAPVVTVCQYAEEGSVSWSLLPSDGCPFDGEEPYLIVRREGADFEIEAGVVVDGTGAITGNVGLVSTSVGVLDPTSAPNTITALDPGQDIEIETTEFSDIVIRVVSDTRDTVSFCVWEQ